MTGAAERVGGRVVEPGPVGPLQALVSGLATLTVGVFAAALILFGALLVFGIVGEEVLSLPSVFDVALRGLIGPMGALVGCAILFELGRRALDRWMRLRAAEARFRENPAAPRLPIAEHRRLRSDPFWPLRIVAMFLVVLGPVTMIVELVSGFEFDGIALVVGALMTAAAIGLFAAATAGGTAWSARLDRIPGPVAATTPRRAARPGAKRSGAAWVVLVVALQIGATVFFGGVLIRQPCRGCDPIDWGGGPMEGVIDVLVGAGALLVAVPVVTLLASTLPFLIGRLRRERRAVRAALAGTLEPDEDAAVQLEATGSVEWLGHGLAVVGFSLLMIGSIAWGALANEGAADEDVAALTGLQVLLGPGAALVAVALAVGVAGVVEARRRRALIHRALPGFDVGAVEDPGED